MLLMMPKPLLCPGLRSAFVRLVKTVGKAPYSRPRPPRYQVERAWADIATLVTADPAAFRRKKVRCPGEQPKCSFCERLRQTCTYAEDPGRDNEPPQWASRMIL